MTMVGVIDYGCGNPGSVVSMLRRINVAARRVRTLEDFDDCDRFVLPGVGAFDDVVLRFRASGLEDVLRELVTVGARPLLGICVGMQMLAGSSEEGVESGLSLVPGRVRHLSRILPSGTKLPVMGWQYVDVTRPSLIPVDDETRFYFTHSFYFDVEEPDDLILIASNAGSTPAAVLRANILGTQFHPEKSHRFGMALLTSFSQWEPTHAHV
jgi:imidazole glycerol-phosphate synthase subunit HisH